MVNVINGNLNNSKENFVVRLVDCQGDTEMDGHVEKEYLRYLKHYNKTKENIHGRVQYIPVDIWAIGMADTIENKNVIAYDTKYQYIANLFGHDSHCDKKENLKAIKKGLKDVFYKARKIGATIAIPFGMGKANWNDIYNAINEMSEHFNVDVGLYKTKKNKGKS